jgi:hypothetical protein
MKVKITPVKKYEVTNSNIMHIIVDKIEKNPKGTSYDLF